MIFKCLILIPECPDIFGGIEFWVERHPVGTAGNLHFSWLILIFPYLQHNGVVNVIRINKPLQIAFLVQLGSCKLVVNHFAMIVNTPPFCGCYRKPFYRP